MGIIIKELKGKGEGGKKGEVAHEPLDFMALYKFVFNFNFDFN